MAGSKEKGIADGEIVRIEKVVKRHEGNFVTEIQK